MTISELSIEPSPADSPWLVIEGSENIAPSARTELPDCCEPDPSPLRKMRGMANSA
jgi:hypothetical protein